MGPSYELLGHSKSRDFGKFRIMARDTLNQCAKIWPCDSEYKSPVVLWVQITVCEDEKTFVTLRRQLVFHNYVEKVLCVELLAFSV